MSIFEVDQVEVVRQSWASQINRLMAICLSTLTSSAMVNFPRPVSIPNTPSSIFDCETSLKSLTQSPLSRLIFSNNLDISIISPLKIFDGKNWIFNTFPKNLHNRPTLASFDINLTTIPKSIYFPLHPGSFNVRRMNWKSREFLKLQAFSYW